MERSEQLPSYTGNPVPQYAFSLGHQILFWHGGQSSGLYAVGSTLTGSGNVPDYQSMVRAVDELRNMRRYSNYPDQLSMKSERHCLWLAKRLERLGRRLYGKDAFPEKLES